jgi:tetratricopeptide (TPR) repeat protein
LILLDDFEQNIEGVEKGQPDKLIPEAADLLNVLLQYLPFSGKMTQIMITSRYSFSLEEQGRDLVKERLEWITLTSFPELEQRKKARELENIFYYGDQSLVPKLVAAGHGNPRLMEWLDVLVGQMDTAEVPQLLEAFGGKQEEFIREHLIRELLQRGGEELARLLHWFSIYRQPVLIDGVRQVGEKAGLGTWEVLLQEGIGLSLIEHDQARGNYQLTPLLREELLAELKDLNACHRAAFPYYEEICKAQEAIDPVQVEEWIYHALGCGEEEVASDQGGRLVQHLRDRLAFRESRRVGLWVLEEKKRELSTAKDTFLLNEIALTIDKLGKHRKAIEYLEKALKIDRDVYVKVHPKMAIRFNNLGLAWKALGDPRKAIDYFKQALTIDLNEYGEEHPDVARDFNNLGESWRVLGEPKKAIDYFEQALKIDRDVYGEMHHKVAIRLNNLGAAWNALRDHQKAIDYFEQALNIDCYVYGKEHPAVAGDLSNLGWAYHALGEPHKAIEYHEQALSIRKKVYVDNHPDIAISLNNLGAVYCELGQKKEAKVYLKQAYDIFKKFLGPKHPYTKGTAKWLKRCR